MASGKKNKKKIPNKKRNNTNLIHQGFFAFPSVPEHSKSIIEKAIELVNKSINDFELISWTAMEKSSSRIISNIIESINKCEILLADISALNPNVLFEVGYAFGAGKKLLLYIQGVSSSRRDEDLRNIEILKGLTIEPYENSEELARKICNNFPDIYNRTPEINKYVPNAIKTSVYDDKGLFLKGMTNHQLGLEALAAFKHIFLNCIVDDWKENANPNLMFYLKSIEKSSSIVALFVDKDWDYSSKNNAYFSFICGLALALKRNVLMIGLPGFNSPFDYQEIMIYANDEKYIKEQINIRFKDTKESEPTINQLSPETTVIEGTVISSIKSNIVQQEKIHRNIKDKENLTDEDKEIILIDLNIGDSVAENEERELNEYFVETGQYYRALKARQAIIVGTKGSGKTACFFKLRDQLKYDVQNLVCEIKPADYKMERFLKSLTRLDQMEGHVGHILENAWKTVIYSSILDVLSEELQSKPIYVQYNNDENELLDFIAKHKAIVGIPFEQKLEKVCLWLKEVSYNVDNFSEKVHNEFLSKAKKVIAPFIRKRNKVVILFDNLDKTWKVNSDLNIQAQFFFSLLGVHRRLQSDFGIENVSILVFMRRNIFEYILNNVVTREPDKLIAESIELVWNDRDMLLRVIEERFKEITKYWKGNIIINPWDTFFNINDKNFIIKDKLYEYVLPRPRDLIQFMQSSIEWAINHNHHEIELSDLESARNSYSSFAFGQIIAEYKAEEPWLFDLLSSFNGENPIFNLRQLMNKIKKNSACYLSYDDLINKIIVLVNINFMGVKYNNNTSIEYAYDMQKSRTLATLIKSKSSNKKLTFHIHPVFYRHLNISTTNKNGLLTSIKNILGI